MTDDNRTVQVPVSKPSLCAKMHPHEPHATIFRVWANDGYYDVPGTCPGVSAEPPRIEDMAPGTAFVGDWGGYVTGGLFVRLNDGVRCLTPGRAFSGWAMTLASAALDIDPSTIRDVTPPKEA